MKIGCEAMEVAIFDVNSDKICLFFFENFMILLHKMKSFRRTLGLITKDASFSNRFPNPPANNE